jgi:uncharacterized protein
MQIPTRDRCFDLIQKMQMLDHIKAHSIQVCRVATALAVPLADHPASPDLKLIQAAALLHDITKTRSFKTGEQHAATGESLLKNMGYPEVGRIIGQHVQLEAYVSADFPTEAEIINYADKRVLHDKIVSLKERMNYIDKRYGKSEADRKRIKNLRELTIEMERWLFQFLPFSPGELLKEVPKI